MQKSKFRKGLVLGIIVLFIGASVVPSAGMVGKSNKTMNSRAILYVGGSGAGNYTKIQDAIDNASNGDTIYVYNGTYNETIWIDKSINLIGEDKNNTIIDGNNVGDVTVRILVDSVNISGFTIQESGNGYSGVCTYASNTNISNNIIKSNGNHGIITRDSNNNIISNNIIFGNEQNGIILENSNNNTISDCSVYDNNNHGVLIYVQKNKNANYNKIVNCELYENGVDGFSMGADESPFNLGANQIIHSKCHDNSRWGILTGGVSYGTNHIISDCEVYSNGLGGIYINSYESRILNTSSYENEGDGVCLMNADDGLIMNCTFYNNTNEGIDSSYTTPNNVLIYRNNFINNNPNAYDTNNEIWYNDTLQEGNYWSDYTGNDTDGDGIGDTPYNITGGSNQDLYPLMYPWYPTHPDTVYVDDDYDNSTPGWGYDRFNRIQYGVNEVEGSTVYVYNGTYYENVVVDKTINLIGEDRNSTIIDGGGSGDVVYISADWVNITGFSMRNSGSSPFQDAGLDISSSSNCNVEDCLFFNNGYAGVQVFSASDCQLVKCHVYQNHEGMFILNSNNIQILDCICNDTGNGIRVDSAGCWNVNIVNCTTYNNIGSGIIFIQGASNNNVVGCVSYNNSYGISFYKSGTTNNNCFNCTIFENEVGIRCNRSADNNLIYHNNLINNIMNAVDECNNTWNDSYPSCGNYWSDYTGDDLYSGPNQDIPGSDGIGDIPYNIPGGSNQDLYPCKEPNGWINSPPNIPDRPSGEIIVLPGVEHTYTTSTIDPDSDSIWFKWDWGDGTYTDWLGPYDSGEEASATASWSQGTYQIRVKAKDNRNPETEWSESLTVNIIYPNFETVFLFGQIGNLNESSELSSFNAVKLLWINFNPIFPQILTSNESIVISNKYFGILRPSFIFGFFNAMILT